MIEGDDDEGVGRSFSSATSLGISADGTSRVMRSSPWSNSVGCFQAAIFNEHGVGDVVEDGGIGMDLAENAGVFTFVAGFLTQFADSGGDRVGFLGVHHAAGDLKFHGVRAMAILLDHDELLAGGDGDDVDPVATLKDIKIMFLAPCAEKQRYRCAI